MGLVEKKAKPLKSIRRSVIGVTPIESCYKNENSILTLLS